MTGFHEFGEDMARKRRHNDSSKESLPKLPKAPLTKEQIDSMSDPLDLLIKKKGSKTLAQIEVDDLLEDIQ